MITCKNCAHEFEGNYCPECGQKASTKRFSMRIVFKDFVKKVLPLEKGFIYTTFRLFTRPGQMLREYLAGKRMDYTKPLQYLFFIAAVSLIFFPQQEFEEGMEAGLGGDHKEKTLPVMKSIMDFMFSHFSLVMISLVPFIAFFSWRLYKKSKVNYAEHFIINCYVMAGTSLISAPLTFLSQVSGIKYTPAFSMLMTVPYIMYMIWAYVDFFQPRNKWLGIFKPVFVYVLAYMTYIFLFTILLAISLGIYFAMGGKR